ncbi:hypothetical protein L3X38_024014 [Prunus dulcis]|uniref:Uncharacterized protein n=1 Tax=Prunus dulcis TaxID=3755 RepID=A0AAD4W0X6_PRUDU|nr:hypothetical protein L3X38_024014 [Prunus dulcis]
MHIEKNVCDSIIGKLLEIPGKNKNGIAARLDLLNIGVKTDLQPEYGEKCTHLPPGPWNLSRAEKRVFCNSFYGMKVLEAGVPSSQKMRVSKSLSGCTVSLVDRDLLNQTRLYVLENTEEVLPYIEEHMIHIKTTYPNLEREQSGCKISTIAFIQ